MSENTHTPLPYWISMRLSELRLWIDASNKLQKEREKRMKQARKKK